MLLEPELGLAAPLAVAMIAPGHEQGRAIKASRRLGGANPKGLALMAWPLMPQRRQDGEGQGDDGTPYTTLTDATP